MTTERGQLVKPPDFACEHLISLPGCAGTDGLKRRGPRRGAFFGANDHLPHSLPEHFYFRDAPCSRGALGAFTPFSELLPFAALRRRTQEDGLNTPAGYAPDSLSQKVRLWSLVPGVVASVPEDPAAPEVCPPAVCFCDRVVHPAVRAGAAVGFHGQHPLRLRQVALSPVAELPPRPAAPGEQPAIVRDGHRVLAASHMHNTPALQLASDARGGRHGRRAAPDAKLPEFIVPPAEQLAPRADGHDVARAACHSLDGHR